MDGTKKKSSLIKALVILFVIILLIGVLVFLNRGKIAGERKELLALTSLAPLYYLTSDLAEGTQITVKHLFPEGQRMADQGRWFKENGSIFEETAKVADAVVTIGSVWKNDPLYPYARRYNLFVVNIDAATPSDPLLSGVSKIEAPQDQKEPSVTRIGQNGGISPYVWLSVSNGIKMAELIASDLKRLSPEDSGAIEKNLDQIKSGLLALKVDYDMALLEAGAFSVIALSGDFVYFTDDFAIAVERYFLKEGYFWNDADIDVLKETIAKTGVYVAISGVQPREEISKALDESGAILAVLDTMDSNRAVEKEKDGYRRIMEKNLKKLLEAFSNF
jgi:hypothetical protein